ncbi:MAG: glucuronate isomerase [Planctomycetota bacterium]
MSRDTRLASGDIPAVVRRVVGVQPALDIHTHLWAPRFNAIHDGFLLWGIDSLLDYHYLHAELLRAARGELSPARLFAMSKRERADTTWRVLFRERAPLSEACRGVMTTLHALGLDPTVDSLESLRSWFEDRDLEAHVDHVMRLANVERVTMTNEVFDPRERAAWEGDASLGTDGRFAPVVRIDKLLRDPGAASSELASLGYTGDDLSEQARLFLSGWVEKTGAVYVAASLPPIEGASLTGSAPGDRVLLDGVLPVLGERRLPLALMIGARRGVNPSLRSAGDGVGPSDLAPLAELCAHLEESGVPLLTTFLAREDQHALCVLARKFACVTPFGCWWFLNTHGLIGELTTMRLELLGTTFIPQHSDARVLEQLIYKWAHTRDVLADVLSEQLVRLAQSGGQVTLPIVEREVEALLRGNALSIIPYKVSR